MQAFHNINNVMQDIEETGTELEQKLRSVPYDKYFGEMGLAEEDKNKRIKLAKDLENALLFLFALISTVREYDYTDISIVVLSFTNRYREALSENLEISEDLESYITLFATQIIDTTYNHLDDDADGEKTDSSNYYLSNDRAMYVAENESNTIWNNEEYAQAKRQGKTKKKWIDIRDKRERKTHLRVGGTVKPIDEPFIVGNSLMQFPKDDSLNAEDKEIINCRCTIRYF
jgi:hypothetical protein